MSENILQRMERIDAKQKISSFMVKEKQPYDFKVKYAAIRANEFAEECYKRGLNYHVSVGGLDSITLFLFLKSLLLFILLNILNHTSKKTNFIPIKKCLIKLITKKSGANNIFINVTCFFSILIYLTLK